MWFQTNAASNERLCSLNNIIRYWRGAIIGPPIGYRPAAYFVEPKFTCAIWMTKELLLNRFAIDLT
jgi:hypothetical protein